MTTHAQATADLTVGPPVDDCDGKLKLEGLTARDGRFWDVFVCERCNKSVFVEDAFALFGGGERFTEEPQQTTEEPQQAEPQQATEEPQQKLARKRGRPPGSRNRKGDK
jgi:hypothetical protein